MLADFGFTAVLLIFFYLVVSPVSQLPYELAERNSTKIGHMLGSA